MAQSQEQPRENLSTRLDVQTLRMLRVIAETERRSVSNVVACVLQDFVRDRDGPVHQHDRHRQVEETAA